MSEPSSNAPVPVQQRLQQIERLVDEFRTRMRRGESIDAEQLVSSHPDLMPELADALNITASRAHRTMTHSWELGAAGRATLDPGRLEAPGYRLGRPIGRPGGQGAVFTAVQLATGREVALKVLRAGMYSEAGRLRFRREVELLGQIRHPNVVTVFDSGASEDGSLFYAMDYILGDDLDDYLRRTQPPRERVLRLFLDICEGLHAAHVKGIIPRDVKPSNVRVATDGRPVVVDFGLAKELSEKPDERITDDGQFVGTPRWASPEHFTDQTDTRSDVYALGVMLYEALTGQMPYKLTGNRSKDEHTIRNVEPPAPRRQSPLIDRELDAIVTGCLAKSPAERFYQNAGELARDLRNYLEGRPVSAKGQTFGYLAWKLARRHWLRVVAGGGAAAAVVR